MCEVYHSILWRPYNLVEELCVECTTLSCGDLTALLKNYVWSVPLYPVETLQPCGGIMQMKSKYKVKFLHRSVFGP